MLNSFYLFVGAIGVMAVLGIGGGLIGYINARVKERRYLKIFNADVQRPAGEKLAN